MARGLRWCRRRWLACAVLTVGTAWVAGCSVPGPQVSVEGIFWQPDAQTLQPRGHWDALGAHVLVVQWSQVGQLGLLDGCGERVWRGDRPDWREIAAQPWAREVIFGLAGDFDESRARVQVPQLVLRAHCIVAHRPPLPIVGWYFPVEIDPSWQDVRHLAAQLRALPRPLWVSVYDNGNVGGVALAHWLAAWLPQDVGVFFQDGVGLYTREPRVALEYVRALQAALGADRVRLIAEAFRPAVPGPGFRPATAPELQQQLQVYAGERVYLFDGPHHVGASVVDALARQRGQARP